MPLYRVFIDSDAPAGTVELPATECNGEEIIEALEPGGFLDDAESDELDVECFDTADGRLGYSVMEGEGVICDVLPEGLTPADIEGLESDPGEPAPADSLEERVIDAEDFHEI